MNVIEEVQLAIDMKIESALDFVYLAKLNRYIQPEGYYAFFNNKLVFLSSFGPAGNPKRLSDLYKARPDLRKMLLERGDSRTFRAIDCRTGEIFPSKYYTNEIFKINYELKRVAESIVNFNGFLRLVSGDERSFVLECLAALYEKEEALQKRKAYLSSDRKIASIILADTKRYPLVDLLNGYGFKLIPSGHARYKMLCPFHREKTPSFLVTADKNRFKCFGCGVGGDPIDFVSKYEGLSVIEAAKKLST